MCLLAADDPGVAEALHPDPREALPGDVRVGSAAPTSLVSGARGVPGGKERAVTHETVSPAAPSRQTARLLACGVVAGPLFLAVLMIQAFTRDGFDLSRHPISLLSLGDLGWIQIANFVVTGALFVACATGMRRSLRAGRSATWAPRLVGAFGVGLIVAGVFTTDAGAGFPPGAPAGAPEQISWHGIVHEVGFGLAFFGMIVGCLVFARRFAALKRRGWVGTCVATAVAVLVLASWPDADGVSVRLVIASALLFCFVAATAARLMRGLPVASEMSAAAGRAHGLRSAA
jgi:hypothetical protein